MLVHFLGAKIVLGFSKFGIFRGKMHVKQYAFVILVIVN